MVQRVARGRGSSRAARVPGEPALPGSVPRFGNGHGQAPASSCKRQPNPIRPVTDDAVHAQVEQLVDVGRFVDGPDDDAQPEFVRLRQ